MRKILVSDFTLKKLAQSGREGLLFREKTAIAACIDAIGVDSIELPPVAREKEDAIIYKTISSVVKNSTLAVPVGYDEKSVNTAWECIKNAQKPCLQVVLPVSTAQMEYSFRMKEAAMLEKIKELVSLSKEKCDNVELVAIDATRSDISFLVKACLAGVECGAVCVTLCDDAGVCLPGEIAELTAKIREKVKVPLFVSLSDNINVAVAGAIAAIGAGADGVKTSMTGGGVLLTEKFASAVSAKGSQLGIETSLKLTELHSDIKSLMKNINKAPQKSESSEALASDDVFLDSNSTLSDVCEAIKLLGYDLSDEDNGKVHKALMQVCERKSSVGARELEALIASYAMQAPAAYHLVSYNASCSNLGSSMAQVTLENEGETISGVAIGDGPIDSAFRAIEQSIGYHYELDNFQIQAVTEGKEALGSTLVRLRNRGKLYSGTGLSTDIVGASIRAYINALNKIVYEEN